MKILFAGTSEFGIPTLEKLKDQLVLIITQPDKPTGRDKKLAPSQVKIWAEKNNIRVIQPNKIADALGQIKDEGADVLLVAAYGQIVPSEVLSAARHGSVNIHGSLLPKYRGASPVQATIRNGDKAAGITLIQMDEKMDHGPILLKKETSVAANETFSSLYKKLSLLAADATPQALDDFVQNKIQVLAQDHSKATFTKLLAHPDGKIDWTLPAIEINRLVRAYNPEPGTWTKFENKLVKILETEVVNDHKIELPGKLYTMDGWLTVKCQDSGLKILKLKPEGKNEMAGKDFVNGLKNLSGKLFT